MVPDLPEKRNSGSPCVHVVLAGSQLTLGAFGAVGAPRWATEATGMTQSLLQFLVGQRPEEVPNGVKGSGGPAGKEWRRGEGGWLSLGVRN